MNMDPAKAHGVFGWILTGFIGATVALFIAYLVPSVIPARVTATRI